MPVLQSFSMSVSPLCVAAGMISPEKWPPVPVLVPVPVTVNRY